MLNIPMQQRMVSRRAAYHLLRKLARRLGARQKTLGSANDWSIYHFALIGKNAGALGLVHSIGVKQLGSCSNGLIIGCEYLDNGFNLCRMDRKFARKAQLHGLFCI